MNNPFVSVICPCYNAEKYLDACIESVLAQTYHNYELICVNDGSKDNTAQILEHYASQHPHIKIIHLAQNSGIGAGRNAGLAIAQGEFWAYLDSDDILLPNYISEKMAFAVQNPHIDILTNWTEVFVSDSNQARYILKPVVKTPLADLLSYRTNVIASPSSFMIRRGASEKIGLWREDIRSTEDWEFYVRCAENKLIFGVVPQILVRYRIHEGQLSNKIDIMTHFSTLVFEDALKRGAFHQIEFDAHFASVFASEMDISKVDANRFYRYCKARLYLMHAGNYWKMTPQKGKAILWLLRAFGIAPVQAWNKVKGLLNRPKNDSQRL